MTDKMFQKPIIFSEQILIKFCKIVMKIFLILIKVLVFAAGAVIYAAGCALHIMYQSLIDMMLLNLFRVW